MILNTICTLLIKGNKTSSEYFPWYQKAVEEDFRIARLYEYYMIAMDETRMRGPLPRKIYLYFMHGNTLDYRKEAFLYANLLTYSDDQAMFLNYREQIVTFTWEQLMKLRGLPRPSTIYELVPCEPGMIPTSPFRALVAPFRCMIQFSPKWDSQDA